MGLPLDTSLVGLYEEWARLGENLTPPKMVESSAAPCKENILTGDDIDLFKFPVPQWYPKDGGRLHRHRPFHHQQGPRDRLGQPGNLPQPAAWQR